MVTVTMASQMAVISGPTTQLGRMREGRVPQTVILRERSDRRIWLSTGNER